MSRLAAAALLLVASVVPAAGADAVLVMFEKPGCSWCAAWERDIGATYDKTEEGAALPLRRFVLGSELPPELAAIRPVVFTPTFVVLQCGREAGRITGYPGEAHFYGLLGELLDELRRRNATGC